MINPKIFKAYDIRGIYPDEINEKAAKKIGAAFAKFLAGKTKRIIVGRDARISSPSLFEALTNGIISQGMNVIDIGICTTPMLIFAVRKINNNIGGVMVSASHSPPEYNGFKLMGAGSVQMADIKRKEIDDLAMSGGFTGATKKGKILQKSILDDYASHILKFARNIKGLKIVVDYGNGVGSVSGKAVLSQLPIKVISLYDELDGNFPNHLPDPHHIENMAELRKRVKSENANLGIFFDGDADRAIMIDEKGEIVFTDLLVALLAREELKKYPGEKIYYDLRFSKVVKEIIEESGGVPVMMRVGNPFYKEKMIFEGGALAGEFSGHIMFKDNFGIDDGLFAAIKTMSLMRKSNQKLSELINPLKKYFATEEINLRVGDGDRALQRVAKHFNNGHSIDLDGVYIEYPDWWFNLRKSNTEPLVRLRIEADTKELMENKKNELLKLIQ